MKTTLLITLAAFVTVVFGQTAAADTMGHGPMMSNQSMPMMSTMHQQMQAMQSQMKKIHATRDQDERMQLMSEHMQSMQEAMEMIGSIPHPDMQTATMGMGGAHSSVIQQCTDGSAQCQQMNQMADWQRHMQQRMDMMQMMMQQMLEHEAVGDQDTSK